MSVRPSRNTPEKRNPAAREFHLSLFDQHTQRNEGCTECRDSNRHDSERCEDSWILCGVPCTRACSLTLGQVRVRAINSTFPIGIIRMLDRSDRLQCTQAPQRWGNKTRQIREITFLLLIHLHRRCSGTWSGCSEFTSLSTSRTSEGTNENKQEGQGKIKIQKYIFMFIFIYIYIFTRYVSTKRKHPKFQNRQSVFFLQMCPCFAMP